MTKQNIQGCLSKELWKKMTIRKTAQSRNLQIQKQKRGKLMKRVELLLKSL